MRVLLVTPPLLQLNTPYPATPHLCGFLRSRGIDAVQADAGLEWILGLLGRAGLARVREALAAAPAEVRDRPSVRTFLLHADRILTVADAALAFLQSRDFGLAHRIAGRELLPEGGRFAQLGPPGEEAEYLDWAFGSLGIVDRARYFATLFFEDQADAIAAGIDPHFGFARYAESLARSPAELDPLLAELERDDRLTTQALDELTRDLCARHAPDVVGMTLPFPGTVLGALRMARTLRRAAPAVRIVWGGGWVNTELRSTSDPRLFDLVDAICYDDGEQPLLALLRHWANAAPASALVRTRRRDAPPPVLPVGDAARRARDDVPMDERGTPTYAGLPLTAYPALIDDLNPMQRLWSDTRWNKLVLAHGCYWRKCTFCDTSLPYICRYEPTRPEIIVDRVEALIAETGCRGFHFVDEAAPPALLRDVARELCRRELVVSFWGNIRFEKTFTPALCAELARAGCIAVTGGIETPHPRLLELVNKGVTLEQVARVTHAFSQCGIRVHAYLIYGAPTETVQETVDGLEVVRQLFAAGCLDSGFWHRLAVTAHAPMGQRPESFGVRLLATEPARFAHNDVPFADATGVDHDPLGAGLRRAVYNYMHGLGIDADVRTWFDVAVPRARLDRGFVRRVLAGLAAPRSRPRGRPVLKGRPRRGARTPSRR
jgi:radical SAM superfamily enzyme YgiQ (UPF0313 family)